MCLGRQHLSKQSTSKHLIFAARTYITAKKKAYLLHGVLPCKLQGGGIANGYIQVYMLFRCVHIRWDPEDLTQQGAGHIRSPCVPAYSTQVLYIGTENLGERK